MHQTQVTRLEAALKQASHERDNARGKAHAYDSLTAILKPYLTDDKNWLTTAHTIVHRMEKAEQLLRDVRDAIRTVNSTGGGGTFSRHVLPLLKDISRLTGND